MQDNKERAVALIAERERLQAWMRAHGRRNVEKAREVSKRLQAIREELAI